MDIVYIKLCILNVPPLMKMASFVNNIYLIKFVFLLYFLRNSEEKNDLRT